MGPMVLYHAQCRDGFCAAWCAWRRQPRATFHPVQYGSPPPDVRGRDVWMIDFSYPPDVLAKMADEASSLLVLDHHKTAQAALEGFSHPRATVVFDMERSGAGIAWDYLFPGRKRPWLVGYVEDRDLWRNALPNGAAVNAYISTLPFEFETWYQASKMTVGKAARLGEVVENKIRQYVVEVAKNSRRVRFPSGGTHAPVPSEAAGQDVPLVNAPQIDVSELGSYLANGEPFAVAWWQRADGMFVYSLRSREPSEVDVSAIAKAFGGGGHARAAGFQVRSLLF